MAQPIVEPCSRGVIEAQPCPRAAGRVAPLKQRRMVLAACILASSMAFIDGSALTVALPKLRAAVGADLAAVQWVINGYILALASLTLIGGALADTYGKARVLAIGCLLFGAASMACALVPSAGWLIAARVVQGVAAALVTPSSLALIGATYPKDERNAAIGVWAAASAFTTAGGPVLGGWLTETFGWQAVFWINPPIAAAAVALLWTFAPADRLEPRRFDLVGAAIIATALGVLAWALSQIGRSETQASVSATTIVVAGLFGVIGLAVYFFWERVSTHPMTPPRLARNGLFLGLNIATLFIYAGLAIMFFLLPFDLVDRRHLAPVDAGLGVPAVHAGPRPVVANVWPPRRQDRRADDADRGPAGRGACFCVAGARARCGAAAGRAGADGVIGDFVCGFGGAAHGLGLVERDRRRRGPGFGHQQCRQPRGAACRRRGCRGLRLARVGLSNWLCGRRGSLRRRRADHRPAPAAGEGARLVTFSSSPGL